MARRIRQKTKDARPRIKPVMGEAKITLFEDADVGAQEVCFLRVLDFGTSFLE